MKGRLVEVGSEPARPNRLGVPPGVGHRPTVKIEMDQADAQALAAHLYRPVEVVPAGEATTVDRVEALERRLEAAVKVLQKYKGRVEASRLGLAALRGE